MTTNQTERPNYELEVTPEEVKVQYTTNSVGCLVIGVGIMTAASLFILFYITGDSGIIRSFLAIIFGGIGTLFFGVAFLTILLNMKRGKVQFRIKDGKLINRKHAIPLASIKEIDYGQYPHRITGWAFKSMRVKTNDNKTAYYDYYNLVTEETVAQVIDKYIAPHLPQEGRAKWDQDKQRHNK
jgi:membrane protein YdbS with pleckstrin-like domain